MTFLLFLLERVGLGEEPIIIMGFDNKKLGIQVLQ